MANTVIPQRLNVPQLPAIHLADPATGQAIKQIVDYVNTSVTPPVGNKIPTRKGAPGNP